MASAEVVDDLTALIKFNGPRPRFMFELLMSKFDTGIWWVPEHVFKDVEDVAAFPYFDVEKGWPLATGPYHIVAWNNTQKFIDRRDDWWGAQTGFAELPVPLRILATPRADDTIMVQRMINNEVDQTLDLRATTIGATVAQNPAIVTHTMREAPYGYMDWWPTSMWFNHDAEPYNDKNVRWAVSYSIDRQQMLDVALEGSGILTELPFPYYEPMLPYVEATKPLLEQYPTMEFNLDKAAERMQAAGYEKDGDGFWVKDGERIQADIGGWSVFADIGPVIAEQLRRGGFEAQFSMPADHGTRISEGTAKIWLNGHGGSIADPYTTLDYYTGKYYAPIGEPTAQNSRYNNPAYDAILEEMALIMPIPTTPPTWISTCKKHGNLAGRSGRCAHPAVDAPHSHEHHLLDRLAHGGEPLRQRRHVAPHPAVDPAETAKGLSFRRLITSAPGLATNDDEGRACPALVSTVSGSTFRV
ncbi:MAG: ABC transporter substrate-binding protein [Caldilineaceae bacterium]